MLAPHDGTGYDPSEPEAALNGTMSTRAAALRVIPEHSAQGRGARGQSVSPTAPRQPQRALQHAPCSTAPLTEDSPPDTRQSSVAQTALPTHVSRVLHRQPS